MIKKTCYKCGKEKVAIGDKDDLDMTKIKMTKMGYGKHINKYRCKTCKEN